jgi:hypothetical protein
MKSHIKTICTADAIQFIRDHKGEPSIDLHESDQSDHWGIALSVEAADGSQASIWTRQLSDEIKSAIEQLLSTLS